jgi:hypothetical protein
MLPGFRFLFAAMMLSMSLLVFGLGAAALLRAAHESFATNPSWHAAPEVAFAQRPETTPPVLATLRVDTTAIEKAPIEKPIDPAKVGAAPADRPASPVEAAASEQVVASKPTETLVVEAAKPDGAAVNMPAGENPPPAEAMLAAAEATAAEIKTAATTVSETPPANNEPAIPPSISPSTVNPATTDPTVLNPTTAAPATAEEADSATTKIATLGGPPVDIADIAPAAGTRTARSDRVRPDPTVMRKRLQARRLMQRRRLAARARLAAQAQQQLQANPFGQQPLTTVAPR